MVFTEQNRTFAVRKKASTEPEVAGSNPAGCTSLLSHRTRFQTVSRFGSGGRPAAAFGPLRLKSVRDHMNRCDGSVTGSSTTEIGSKTILPLVWHLDGKLEAHPH